MTTGAFHFPLDDLAALRGRVAGMDAPVQGPALAAEIRGLGVRLASEGLPGAMLGRLLGELNDVLVSRVVLLTAAESRLPAVSWVWLALGSQGRFEQSFCTDQDNGLLFSAADEREAEALRQHFVPFGECVNDRLADCGFARCSGGVMAGNPAWCLSQAEWRQHFFDWVRKPEAMALMHATIFFDFRPLTGQVALAEALRTDLLAQIADTPVFLHLMASNALHGEIPLTRLGDFYAVEQQGRKGLDLKHCARLLVDAARIFALANGVPAVDTASRLLQAGPLAGLTTEETAAAVDAFQLLLRLRLREQAKAVASGQAADHLLEVGAIHELDKAILKAALQQVRRVQQRLRLNYGL